MGGRGATSSVAKRQIQGGKTIVTKFKPNKQYNVNYKNGNPAGTLVIEDFSKFKDQSFGVNKAYAGTAKLNGKSVAVTIVGTNGDVLHFSNKASRYDFVSLK
jgi:hypothetical protein